MGTKREDIIGKKLPNGDYVLTARDMKTINDITRTLYMKSFGNISIADITDDFKTMLYRNVVQFPSNNEGNLDVNFPHYAKFFIPENTKEIKSATLSAITGKFRMDSAVTAAASIPTQTAVVKRWYNSYANYWVDHPTEPINKDHLYGEGTQYAGLDVFMDEDKIDYWQSYPQYIEAGVYGTTAYVNALDIYYMIHNNFFAAADYFLFQHNHDISLPEHWHNQTPGIFESSVIPSIVKIYVNGSKVGADMNGVNVQQNNIDIKDKLVIGQWNEIKVTAANASRITLYGLADLIQQFT